MPMMLAGGAGHDHEGPYCVHELPFSFAVRAGLEGYLLRRPYQNAAVLAALGDNRRPDPSVTARMFMQDKRVEGAVITVSGRPYLSYSTEAVLPHVLAYTARSAASPLAALIGGRSAMPTALIVPDHQQGDVKQAWQKLAKGNTSKMVPMQEFVLHSEVLNPPALPGGRFDNSVRKATAADHDMILRTYLGPKPKELKSVPSSVLVDGLGFASAHVIEGKGDIRRGIYNLAPIGQSGALLNAVALSINGRGRALQAAALRRSWHAITRGAVPDVKPPEGTDKVRSGDFAYLKPELAEHLSALAKAMQREGRWLMVALNDVRKPRVHEDMLPLREAAEELGFMPAGGDRVLALKSKPVRQSRPAAGPGMLSVML